MNYKQYFSVVAIFSLAWSLCVLMNYLYLKHNGETLSINEIVKLQTIDPSILYGTAINENRIAYKLELFKQKRPKIITFGESRVVQFRDYFFSKDFVNLGGAWSNMRLTKSIALEIVKEHRPEVVIISVDYWLFDDIPDGTIGQFNKKNNVLAGIIKPWIWLKDKKISFKNYFSDLFNYNKQIKAIGVMGRYRQAGFRGDGSYYYNDFISGATASNDWNFRSTLDQLKSKDFIFRVCRHMNREKFNHFLEILDVFSSRGVKVVLFMPPLAPTVYAQLKKEISQFSYYQEVTEVFNENHLFYANFHDPALVDADDCEFIDGLHPGDTVYARILLKLANLPEYAFLKNYVNLALLQEISETYRHVAFILQQKNQIEEKDFLGIGCKKPKQSPLTQLTTQKFSKRS